MSDQKLESFKIGDKHKPRVKSAPAVKPVEKPVEPYTLGFARIEGILDNEPPQAVLNNLNRIGQTLADEEEAAKSPKGKAPFKKARVAVTRTMELLEYLFQTKEAMIAAAAKGQSNSNEP